MPRPRKRKIIGQNRGIKLTDMQRELIIQNYALCGNKSEVARMSGVSITTVNKILKEAETTPAIKQARSRALEEIAGRVHQKTEQIIESIAPHDLESGQIKQYDEDGNLVSVKSYGPSLLQKVTSAAILTDKLKVLEETKRALAATSENEPGKLPLPGDIETALRQIGERVKRLRILDIQFEEKAPELASRVQEVAHRAGLDNVTDVEFEELDFDNVEP